MFSERALIAMIAALLLCGCRADPPAGAGSATPEQPTPVGDRRTECGALLDAIQRGTASLAASQKQGDAAAVSALRDFAASADRSRAEVDAVVLTVPELQAFSADYLRMTTDLAANARSAADAADKLDLDAIERHAKAMDDAAGREAPIVDGLNAFCGAR